MSEAFERAVEAHRRGDFDVAERGYRDLVRYRNARHNLGVLYSQWGHLDAAEEALRPIVEQAPDYPAAAFSLAMVLLAQERYAEAWPLYESRRKLGTNAEPMTEIPEWSGAPCGRLAVHAEQGYGDQVLFARFLPLLPAESVVVICEAAMRPLFEGAGFEVAPSLPPCDAWTMLGSLPLRLGCAPPPPPLRFRALAEARRGIGVVPTGDPTHPNDRHRSLPSPYAERLLGLGRDLRPEATCARDFSQTAELIAGLQSVVAVDTAVANLAASMGVEATVLLPFIACDWRWGRGETSPWYPAARLVRQSPGEGWAGVMEGLMTQARITSDFRAGRRRV